MATRLRRGAVMGLRWSDISGSTLQVRQTTVRVGKDLVVSAPKTKSGERRMGIAPDVLAVPEAHRER